MNNIILNIWNRDFDLEVTVQNYPGENVTVIQEQTYDRLPLIDFMKSLNLVADYVVINNPLIEENRIRENIFRYVMPKRLSIIRSDKRVFALMCNYKCDPEHGIAIVYENERLVKIGPEDIIL